VAVLTLRSALRIWIWLVEDAAEIVRNVRIKKGRVSPAASMDVELAMSCKLSSPLLSLLLPVTRYKWQWLWRTGEGTFGLFEQTRQTDREALGLRLCYVEQGMPIWALTDTSLDPSEEGKP
jgi:hypothetical protein